MQLDLTNYKNRHTFRSKVERFLWSIVWVLFFRLTPVRSFRRWRIFLLRLFGANIGENCLIFPSCKVWLPRNLEVGNYVAISENVNCYSVNRIVIGNSVTISREAFLCCASHDITSPIMELVHKPIIIESEAWVAARAFIGPGVKVGQGAVVAACAVVTRDVNDWTVVAGNPATYIKKRSII
jgi:putative colanic acid biosynthesis acetyltransferase WcaF